MTDTALRGRIRKLMASGDLPDEPLVVVNAGTGFHGSTVVRRA